nr:catalase-related domain-containing protein [Nitrospira sp.]
LAAHGEEGGPRESPQGFTTAPGREDREEQGDKLRVRPELFADHYSQARMFWKSLTDNEQAHLASAFVFELAKVNLDEVQSRMVGRLRNVDEGLAKRIADGLGMPLPGKIRAAREPIEMKPSPALSIQKNMLATLKGRKVGLLYAEGSNGGDIDRMIKQVEKAGGTVFLVAPKLHGTKLENGKELKADGQLAASPSQLFDAVAIILSAKGAQMLLKEGAAIQFVMDAFGHLKAIGHSEAAQPLLDKAGVVPDEGVTDLRGSFVEAAAKRFFAREPSVRTLA